LNIPRPRASVSLGMIKCFVVALAFSSLLLAGCDQQPAAPAGGQSSSSPTPAPSTAPATPASTAPPGPQATPEGTASPIPTVTPEATATPQSTTTPAPETTPAAASVPTATPEMTPAASPTVTPETTPATSTPSPGATPDAVAPSPSSSPSASESDVRPTLSSRSANEYLQSYDDYITDFKSASKAMKEGDMTKYQTVIQRAHELQTKSEKLGGELNPEEEQRFANYLNKKANELAQFASQNR
jgi:hypothetical protein